MLRTSNFLYAICILFLPAVSFTAESSVNEEDELEANSSISGTTLSDLPSSVVHEILLRLPHKSFIQCKSVCKSWLNLISDPYFTKAYFTNPPFTALVLYHRRAVNNILHYVSFRFLEIDHVNGHVTCAPFHPRTLHQFPVHGADLYITGSCNGLLCITHTHLRNVAVYVINPLLGEFLMLPEVEQRTNKKIFVIYGFGCCSRYSSSSSNRYKVLRVVQDFNTGQVHGEIVTVGVDEKWRSVVDDLLTMDLIDRGGVAMNGAVHFLGDVDYSGYILAFDIEEERGRRINLPPGLNDDTCNFHLAVWDDKLCFAENSSNTQVNVWTMKEYGVVESWSKEIVLKSWVPVELRPYPLEPIATLRNKALLMSRESFGEPRLLHLTSYNPTVKMCTKHEVADATEDVHSYWFAYVPNVIPLMDNLLGGGSQ